MSVFGKIKEYKVITLAEELKSLSEDDKACESYVITKHETAEKHGRYVVKLSVLGNDSNELQFVTLFLPKALVDNNLIEKDTFIECSSDSCHLSIIGITDWFDRASNGATQIHDLRKAPYTS